MTRLIIPVLLLTLVVAQPSPAAAGFAAAGFYEGEAAYKRGDFATALRELSPLANLGYAGAQYRLGVMYERGRGVPQDYKTAAKWYRLAAEQGDALAQQSLGVMYGQGQGVAQDNIRAHMWSNIAASQGETEAATKNRDLFAKLMTTSQIETAQKLAQECEKKNYKGC